MTKKIPIWAAGMLVALMLAAGAVAQEGGAFLRNVDYVISGQWTWTQASPFVFEGATDNGFETTFTITDPTADRTVTFPNATGTLLTNTGAVTSSSASAGIGYATGAGCAVTQATSRTTGVTCTGVSGAITTDATSLAAAAEAEFTVTNTSVAVGDAIIVSARSGQTAGTSVPLVTAVAAGSFKITLTNLHATTADTGAMIINFAVIKAVSS